ncbi:hypothetical protein NQ317_001264 [Molorchus minor]|uniref:WD repeat-containing protein 7 n=1 Tax=Molorchus minor TaxID=1323400 RepID=A0ABQ9IW38_9CUCU|nr:hypothetical protein NQ317_001264 [Molorchus minor]
MPGTSLVVPVVSVGQVCPTHCISCIYLSKDQKTLATGCYDGQICLWQVDPDTLHMTPRCLLVGHTAPILCISKASIIQDNNYIVSSSEAGEMCTWDLVDGKCREAVKLTQVHTNIQAYHLCNCEDVRLFCNGYYPEIMVMDPFSLEVLFVLSSKQNPDWISALHVWTLLGHENKHSEPIYENESKQIRTLNAVCLHCCQYNQRTVLVVCTKYWQIYDAGDFSVLCSYLAPRGERWMSGDFLAIDRIIMWSDAGKGYLYKLPANSTPDHKDFHTRSVESDSPFLYCLLNQPESKPLSCPPAMRFVTTCRQNKTYRYLLRGDSEGYVLVWNIPDLSAAQLQEIQQQKPPQPVSMTATVTTSLTEAWASVNPSPVGVLDQLEKQEAQSIKLTASIYLPLQSRLVVGREDGTIIIVPATQTVMLQLLHGNHQQFTGWPPHQILSGHGGRARVQKCICSVASDHSVTLLSLAEKKCVCLASRHLFPVTTIKWRPNDDFMVIGCSDGTVYVWQMETGHLDRVLQGNFKLCLIQHGFTDRNIPGIPAEEVLYACEENEANNATTEVGLANPAVHFIRGLRHRNLSAIRHATQRGLHQLQMLGAHTNNNDPHMQREVAARYLCRVSERIPKTSMHVLNKVLTVTPFCLDPESHILFFDIESLIVELLTEEYNMMSPGSLEAAGLISQLEYSKVSALTRSASPDAQKKIAEKDKHGILAKVKEGAENALAKAESVLKQGGDTCKGKVMSLSRTCPHDITQHMHCGPWSLGVATLIV